MIDLADPAVLAAAPPVQRLIFMVLLLHIKDRVDEAYFVPTHDGFEMWGRLEGGVYQMVPPPKHIGPRIVQEFRTLASGMGSAARESGQMFLPLRLGPHSIDLDITIVPTAEGEFAIMRIIAPAESARAAYQVIDAYLPKCDDEPDDAGLWVGGG